MIFLKQRINLFKKRIVISSIAYFVQNQSYFIFTLNYLKYTQQINKKKERNYHFKLYIWPGYRAILYLTYTQSSPMLQKEQIHQKSQGQTFNSIVGVHRYEYNQKSSEKQMKVNETPVTLEAVNQIQDNHQTNEQKQIQKRFQKSSADKLMSSINAVKNQIISKIFQHNNHITVQSGPSLEEIQKCAQMLQKQFPKVKVDVLIRLLQELLANNCKIEQSIEEQSANSMSQEQLAILNRNDYSKANALVRERAAVRISPETRLSEQKKIAISYLNHGYGVRILRQYVKDPTINSTRYNNVITTIMKLAFRRLEEHIKAMGRAVVPVNSQDEKVIRAPLTNCQKWLPPDELETFYKFIKLACCLEQKVDINAAHAIKLYELCIRQLRQRQNNEQNIKNQKIMRGSHRLPRIAQGMYNIIGNYNQTHLTQVKNGYQNYDRTFYPGQSKMQASPHLFSLNNFQRKRLDPGFYHPQNNNVQSVNLGYNRFKTQTNNSLS